MNAFNLKKSCFRPGARLLSIMPLLLCKSFVTTNLTRYITPHDYWLHPTTTLSNIKPFSQRCHYQFCALYIFHFHNIIFLRPLSLSSSLPSLGFCIAHEWLLLDSNLTLALLLQIVVLNTKLSSGKNLFCLSTESLKVLLELLNNPLPPAFPLRCLETKKRNSIKLSLFFSIRIRKQRVAAPVNHKVSHNRSWSREQTNCKFK